MPVIPAMQNPAFDSLAGLVAVDPLVVTAVGVRMTTVVAAGGLACFPRLGPRIGAAAVLALVAAAVPGVAATGLPPSIGFASPLLVIAGEAVVGLGLGLAVAVAFAAAAWAGGLVASVSGLTWADDFSGNAPTGDGAAVQLACWLAVAGFLAAGGHLVVVAGLVESVQRLPIGSFAASVGQERFAETVGSLPDAALSLALGLALPAVTAVVTFHVAAALCLRSVRFVTGPGILQAAASLVLLAAVVAGAGGWTEGFAATVRPLIERGLQEGGR